MLSVPGAERWLAFSITFLTSSRFGEASIFLLSSAVSTALTSFNRASCISPSSGEESERKKIQHQKIVKYLLKKVSQPGSPQGSPMKTWQPQRNQK